MNKITDSEIRKLFFEFTDDEINGIRYLSQEAFTQALNQALNIHSVVVPKDTLCYVTDCTNPILEERSNLCVQHKFIGE